jgi:hypothetical protein
MFGSKARGLRRPLPRQPDDDDLIWVVQMLDHIPGGGGDVRSYWRGPDHREPGLPVGTAWAELTLAAAFDSEPAAHSALAAVYPYGVRHTVSPVEVTRRDIRRAAHRSGTGANPIGDTVTARNQHA